MYKHSGTVNAVQFSERESLLYCTYDVCVQEPLEDAEHSIAEMEWEPEDDQLITGKSSFPSLTHACVYTLQK